MVQRVFFETATLYHSVKVSVLERRKHGITEHNYKVPTSFKNDSTHLPVRFYKGWFLLNQRESISFSWLEPRLLFSMSFKMTFS